MDYYEVHKTMFSLLSGVFFLQGGKPHMSPFTFES